MKKQYINPETIVVCVYTQSMIAGSAQISGSQANEDALSRELFDETWDFE